MGRMRATSRVPGMCTGSPGKLATGRGELPATAESSAQALCTQAGSCGREAPPSVLGQKLRNSFLWLPGPQGSGPRPTAQMGRQRPSGLAQGHPVSGCKALTPHLLKSEVTVTAGAPSLPRAPCGLLWPQTGSVPRRSFYNPHLKHRGDVALKT